jgi:hypothetical protein
VTLAQNSSDVLAYLAAKHGTDKGLQDVRHRRGERIVPPQIPLPGRLGRTVTLSGKRYTTTYGRFFGPLQDSQINLLEIGIDHGASLAMWEDFFSLATLHAIDIERRCKKYRTDRTSVYIGSQTDPVFLAEVVRHTGALDVVIDDGGHTMEQHRVSLVALWPHVKPGGMYVIEDLHTAYLRKFGGGGKDSTVEVLKTIVDGLSNRDAVRSLVEDVESVWFAQSIAILTKGR